MKKTQVAVAVATALAAGGASAASEWTLTSVSSKSTNGTSAAALSGTLTFSNGAGNALEADGSFSALYTIGMGTKTNELFTWNFGSDFVISGKGNSFGSFECDVDANPLPNFGDTVGASLCGNYNFGANGYNESTVNLDGSGKVIGGDDGDIGPAQSIADFQGFSPNIPPTDFSSIIQLENGTIYSGAIWTFTANAAPIPIPAAAWLFGSALGLLGWVRRRNMA